MRRIPTDRHVWVIAKSKLRVLCLNRKAEIADFEDAFPRHKNIVELHVPVNNVVMGEEQRRLGKLIAPMN